METIMEPGQTAGADVAVDKLPVDDTKDEEISRETVGDITVENPRIVCRNVDVYYEDKQAIKNVSIDIGTNEVVAMIGPSGCGKSTFLRCLNRMNDIIDTCRVTGEISLDGKDINARTTDVVTLRAQVGMVFQRPNPFPKSVFENVAYGPRIHGLAESKTDLEEIAETREALKPKPKKAMKKKEEAVAVSEA